MTDGERDSESEGSMDKQSEVGSEYRCDSSNYEEYLEIRKKEPTPVPPPPKMETKPTKYIRQERTPSYTREPYKVKPSDCDLEDKEMTKQAKQWSIATV